MKNIKVKLRELGITLSEFSHKLQISRPTVDNYIELYESGRIIPKDKYNRIFKVLFDRNIDSKEEFLDVLDKYQGLIERDKILGIDELTASKTDIITSVIEEMNNDMICDDSDENMYIFINMIIRSYRKEAIFKKLAKYFLILNGKEDIKNISEDEEIYLSNYYKLFFEDKNNKLKVDHFYLQKFYDRVNELNDVSEKNKEKLKEEIVEKLMTKVEVLLQMGMDLESIDIKQVLNSIEIHN